MKIQDDLYRHKTPLKIYKLDRPRKKNRPASNAKKAVAHRVCRCHLCGEPVKYNYVDGCYNYKVGKFIFCSWKCIQAFRRANGLIPKEVDYE